MSNLSRVPELRRGSTPCFIRRMAFKNSQAALSIRGASGNKVILPKLAKPPLVNQRYLRAYRTIERNYCRIGEGSIFVGTAYLTLWHP